MKIIARAAIALTLLIGFVGIVSYAEAFDSRTFWQDHDKNLP